MRKIKIVFTLIFASLAALAQNPTTREKGLKNEENEVLKTEKAIANAIVNNDTSIVSSFLTNNYMMTVPEGSNITKRQFLTDMKKFWHPFFQNHTNQNVKIYKYTAIITGVVEFKWRDANKEYNVSERYTDTYIKENSQWRKCASHSHSEQLTKEVLQMEVKKAVETLWLAWETGDKASAESIYAEDFIDTDFQGVRRNKTEVLNFLKPLPQGQTSKIILSDWHFIAQGNVFIVNYIGEDTRSQDGKVISVWKFRATDTLIKKYGHWILMAGQQILIKN